MTIRKLAVLAALAAFSLLALGSASASASTALRTDPGNVLINVASTIRNTTADSATLDLGAPGKIHCNQTFFDADVAGGVSSSSLTGVLTTLTFTTCTDSIAVVNITDCTLSPGTTPTIHVTSNANGGTIDITDPIVRCAIAGSTTSFCYFTGTSAQGAGVNSSSTIDFNQVAVDRATGSGDLGAVCGTSGFFSVRLTHIVNPQNHTVTITAS